jgi:DNA repair photolyase
MAAEAEDLDERNDVEYRDLACRTLITRCGSPRVPFEFQINPYRGCMLGCGYCYARYTHEFMELYEWQDFERKIYVKRGAREALLRDLRRLDLRGKWIAIGTATDPYQPAERRYRLTRAILETLSARGGLRFSVTTKSDLVTRDLDVLRRAAERNEVRVNLTITTPHYRLSRRTEPRAPRPDKRLAAVRELADAGIPVAVFLMPILPHITDSTADLDLLIGLAKEAGARYLVSGVLFLRDCSRKRFLPFIEEEFPEHLPEYRRLYGRGGREALSRYSEAKYAEIRALKAKHGFGEEGRRAVAGPRREEQLELTGW